MQGRRLLAITAFLMMSTALTLPSWGQEAASPEASPPSEAPASATSEPVQALGSEADLQVDLERIRGEIAKAEKEAKSYEGGLVLALVRARLETLRLTEAMLDQKLTALETGASFEFKAPTTKPDPEQAAMLLEEIRRAQDRVREAEKEAGRYSGGLVHALALSTLMTQRQTVAMLEQGYLTAAYGLAAPVPAAVAAPETSSSQPPSASSEPTETPSAETTSDEPYHVMLARNAGKEVIGNWIMNRDRSPLNDFPNVTAVNLDEEADGKPFSKNKALLIGCYENETRFIVRPDTFLLDLDDRVEVVYRIDEEPPVTERWSLSTDNQATGLWGSRSAAPLLRSLVGKEKLFVQVTERRGERHRAIFRLDGIEVVAAEVAKTCGWSLDGKTEKASIGPGVSKPEGMRAQEALKAGGFYAGAVDGRIGPKTKAALGRFQSQNGLPVTGELDDATRQALGL